MSDAATETAATRQPAHRKFVGPPEKYDLSSASQFSLLAALGLRENDSLLDVGCGSLRAGRLLITYLSPERYFGIEPEQWLIDQGIEVEIGKSLAEIKKPKFSNDTNFTLTTFAKQFDFMLAQSIFSHATQAQVRRCFSEAAKALKPTGIFAATYFPGDENYEGTEWVYPGRVHFRPDFFAKMASDEGLKVTPINWTHTHEQSWVAITHPDCVVPDVVDTARIKVLEHQLQAANQKLKDLQKLHGIKMVKKINRLFGNR
jgi:SAM-dependent methyltransferase